MTYTISKSLLRFNVDQHVSVSPPKCFFYPYPALNSITHTQRCPHLSVPLVLFIRLGKCF